MGRSVSMECLAMNGAASNLADGVDFVLGTLHSPKDVLKLAALVTCAQIVEDGVVGVVSAKNRHEAFI
jgi:hypothetical protein